MQNTSIAIDFPSEMLLSLNSNEQDLKNYLQKSIAGLLFTEGKLTLSKAIEFSGLTRYEFEKYLRQKSIPITKTDINEVFSDLEKIGEKLII